MFRSFQTRTLRGFEAYIPNGGCGAMLVDDVGIFVKG